MWVYGHWLMADGCAAKLCFVYNFVTAFVFIRLHLCILNYCHEYWSYYFTQCGAVVVSGKHH